MAEQCEADEVIVLDLETQELLKKKGLSANNPEIHRILGQMVKAHLLSLSQAEVHKATDAGAVSDNPNVLEVVPKTTPASSFTLTELRNRLDKQGVWDGKVFRHLEEFYFVPDLGFIPYEYFNGSIPEGIKNIIALVQEK